MCKVLAMAGINTENAERALRFAFHALDPMVQNDRDGVGYAQIGPSGLAGERWVKPKDAFRVRREYSPADAPLIAALGDAIDANPVYNIFGAPVGMLSANAFIMHSRMKTHGDVSIVNTHPFVNNHTALIHNGVISNQSALKNYTSTCDSECIVNEYVERKVDRHPERIQDVVDKLVGYYACAVLGTDDKGVQYLDIFKSTGASLFCAQLRDLGVTVFATTELILRHAAKKSKLKLSGIFEVKSGRLIRLNAQTAAVMCKRPFSSGYKPDFGYGSTTYHGRHGGKFTDAVTSYEDYQKRERIREALKVAGATPKDDTQPVSVHNVTDLKAGME
jgi:hypothetical protein